MHLWVLVLLACADVYRRDFMPLLERARLAGEGFTIHSLRHTFATTLAEKGVHPSTAQKMLGHSCVRISRSEPPLVEVKAGWCLETRVSLANMLVSP